MPVSRYSSRNRRSRNRRPPWTNNILPWKKPGFFDEPGDAQPPGDGPDPPPGGDYSNMDADYIEYLKELMNSEAESADKQLAAQIAATEMQAATERYKADVERDMAKQGYLSQETIAKINGDVQGKLGSMGIKSDFIQNMTGMKIKSSQDLLDSMLNNEQVKGQIGNDRLKTGLGLQAGLGQSLLGNRSAERMNRMNTMANFDLGMADLNSRERLGLIDQGTNMFQNLQALRTQREGNLLGGVMNSANARSAGERGRQSDLLGKAIEAYSAIGNAPADGWIAQWNQARGQQVPDSAKTGTAANLSQLAGQIGALGLGIDPNAVTDEYMSKLWDRGTDKHQQFIGGLDDAKDLQNLGKSGLLDERQYRRARHRQLMNDGRDGMNEDRGIFSRMMREIGNKTEGGNYLGGNRYDPSNMWDKYKYLNSRGAGSIDPNQELPDDWDSLANGDYNTSDEDPSTETRPDQVDFPFPERPNDMPNYPYPRPRQVPTPRPRPNDMPNYYGFGGDETGYTDLVNQQPSGIAAPGWETGTATIPPPTNDVLTTTQKPQPPSQFRSLPQLGGMGQPRRMPPWMMNQGRFSRGRFPRGRMNRGGMNPMGNGRGKIYRGGWGQMEPRTPSYLGQSTPKYNRGGWSEQDPRSSPPMGEPLWQTMQTIQIDPYR